MKKHRSYFSCLLVLLVILLCTALAASAETGDPYAWVKSAFESKGIPFDPASQCLLIVDIESTVSDHMKSLDLNRDEIEKSLDYDYAFFLHVNGDSEKRPAYYVDRNGEVSALSWRIYSNRPQYICYHDGYSSYGVNVIILNKGDSYELFPNNYGANAYFWGSSTPGFANGNDNNCYCCPRLGAPEAYAHRKGNIQSDRCERFCFEWDIYNWIELETHNLNRITKRSDFAGFGIDDTGNLEEPAVTYVTYKIELRDKNGSIIPVENIFYENYKSKLEDGSWHYVIDEDPGFLTEHILADGTPFSSDYPFPMGYGEDGFMIPAGYDFRISAWYCDDAIGVPLAIVHDTRADDGYVMYDQDGFILSGNDFLTADYIMDFAFIKPDHQIRVEKQIIGTGQGETEYDFNVKRSFFTIASGTWKMPLLIEDDQTLPHVNAPYSLYDAATDRKIGSYRTDAEGNFKLKAGQYALFDVWEIPKDLEIYTEGGVFRSYYFQAIDQGSTVPESSVYTFSETGGNYATRILHNTASGSTEITGRTVTGVNNDDTIIFINELPESVKTEYKVLSDVRYGCPENVVIPAGETYQAGDTVKVAKDISSGQNYAIDSKSGKQVSGSWSFSGWDKKDFIIFEDTVITGSWAFVLDPPKTGDDNQIVLWMFLCAISVCLAIRMRPKKQKQ